MEIVAPTHMLKSSTLKNGHPENDQQVEKTHMNRLHTVDEFIEKLEHAVLQKL